MSSARPAVLTALALLLAACSSAASPAHFVFKQTVIAHNPAPTTSCAAASLRVAGGRQSGGATGVAHGDVDITNRSTASCTLDAPRSVTLLNSSRAALAVRFRPSTKPLAAVTLRPDASARLTLSWTNWCDAKPGPLTIALATARKGATASGPFDGPPDFDFVPGCSARGQPSTVQVIGFTAMG